MQAYICDRCGRVIGEDGLLTRIRVGSVDQETESYSSVYDADLCKTCADAVTGYALKERAAVESAKPGPKPKQRVEVDTGKVQALKKAGWKAKDIAGDMGISVSAVYAALKAEGKEVP